MVTIPIFMLMVFADAAPAPTAEAAANAAIAVVNLFIQLNLPVSGFPIDRKHYNGNAFLE